MRNIIFALMAVALVASTADAQAKGKAKKSPKATLEHLDKLKAAMDGRLDGIEKKQVATDGKVDKVLANQDKILENQSEHGKKLEEILQGQIMMAKQIKDGFDGLGNELGEVKKLASKGVNVTVNNTVPSPPAPPPAPAPAPPPEKEIVYVYRDRWYPVYVQPSVIVASPAPRLVPVYDAWGCFKGYAPVY